MIGKADEAGYLHQPVLLHEAVSGLLTDTAGRYVDGTFGRGGHSRSILSLLDTTGALLATDKDPEAEAVANELANEDRRFCFFRGSFAGIRRYASRLGWDKVSGVLLDLGVSSPQLDDASRGFSFLKEGPLDMRMDTDQGESASAWLQHVREDELARVLWEHGEERYSRRIAKAIVQARQLEAINTTTKLAKIIADAHPRWEKGKHPATKSFQGIRIHINAELDDLKVVLRDSFDLLEVGGRLVVISFHSLEDRIVKQFMHRQVHGPTVPKWVLVTESEKPQARLIAKKIRAGKHEVDANVRARSAVMRVLERL